MSSKTPLRPDAMRFAAAVATSVTQSSIPSSVVWVKAK